MKITTCLIGITLLITSIVMHTQNKDKTIFKNFENLLDEKQKDIYKNIVKERLKIYTMGMILGLSLGAYYIYSNPKDTYLICKFFMIIYTIKLGFYYFYPKQPLMLYSLTNQKQVDASNKLIRARLPRKKIPTHKYYAEYIFYRKCRFFFETNHGVQSSRNVSWYYSSSQ